MAQKGVRYAEKCAEQCQLSGVRRSMLPSVLRCALWVWNRCQNNGLPLIDRDFVRFCTARARWGIAPHLAFLYPSIPEERQKNFLYVSAGSSHRMGWARGVILFVI